MLNAAVESGTRTIGDAAPANTVASAPIAEYVVRVRPCAEGFTATLSACAVEVRASAGPIGMGVAPTAAEAMAEAIASTAMPTTPIGTRVPDEVDPPTL
jgi:hypothetical protein